MAEKLKPLGSVAQLAALLDVSEREVQRLAKDNLVVVVKRGVYDLPGSIVRYIRHLKAKSEEGSGETDELKKERTLLTRAKREEAEIRTAVIKGTVGDMEVLMDMNAEHVSQAKNKLLGIPASYSGQLAMETNPNVIQDILTKAINHSLDELSGVTEPEFIRRSMEKHASDVEAAAEVDG